jgi:hypothetical protein
MASSHFRENHIPTVKSPTHENTKNVSNTFFLFTIPRLQAGKQGCEVDACPKIKIEIKSQPEG